MREWIETNGLGGYASLTQKQEVQRKFHGLLIASLHPPVNRWVFISNIRDELIIDDTSLPLSKYARFSFDFFPTWTYETPYGIIKKTICMMQGHNTTAVKYELNLKESAELNHHLTVNSRHFYDIYNHPHPFSYSLNDRPHSILFQPDNVDENVLISFPEAEFKRVEEWQPHTYEIDCNRNEGCHDHVLYLGKFQQSIHDQESYSFLFSTEQHVSSDGLALFHAEKQRRKNLLQKAGLPSQMNQLVLASDRFLVQKPPFHTIIAGYHWFSDWGRDTLISLPGVTLVPSRFQHAKNILKSIADFSKNGIIPNTFDDRDSSPAYNTVDASLWYIDRVFQYLKYTNDKAFLNQHYSLLQEIINTYQNGFQERFFMDDDYLISHDPGLTWMDVKLGEYYPTPRARKAVEIQALWYNALRIMSLFAQLTDKENPYDQLANLVKKSFNQQYTLFYDVIDTQDESIRPNMIFLSALDFSMISNALQRKIIDIVEEKLLTIFGLRSLEKNDSQYKSSYLGSYHRDLAYHNGTIWPWLLGSFIKAKSRFHADDSDWKSEAFESYVSPMLEVYGEKWEGSIHEIFDADPPFAPRGCISQAWSVAELLRAWTEDIIGKRPPFEHMFISTKVHM